ncbi:MULTISPECIES: serine/threonine-protein kinase [unclassified Coleofasciculus]|uniref:serine/threonine-protein kinase n=1 Tax=unclassified Coleofasciculus TaxID=2692782 RepID=UPI00187E6222|nr:MULTISPECIES: serine/threonine-protein kinase [unclassified Coleofasciculus]MBE9127365.1 serine/threonine protein kinase [Coleofasciculus sp. LEGE 07081]MBE9150652.1 serine/threonine protein kinase [Coleofasciculus sp. LEGE 07092]
MSYCINPICPEPNDPANTNNRICRNCGSELLLQGRYPVMRLLSDNSGFGMVYEAYEGATPKILKVLKQKHTTNSKVIELFQQEAVVLSQLNHPGIPKVESDGYFQFFPREGTKPVHCIVMEKIDGLNLKQWMQQQGSHPISEKQALNWLKQLTEILHLVHQKNYFHRDIKPENIMLRSTGQLVLIDFGTARELTYTYLAEVGGAGNVTKISSAGYTPPEQEKGHAVPQSDFYALGRTFAYLLTAKEVNDRTIYDPLTDRCNWRDCAPDISPKSADFLDKLMASTAAARPKNTQEILDEIADILQQVVRQSTTNLNESTVIQLASVSQSTKRLFLLNPKLKLKIKWLLVGVIILVAGLGGYGTWQLYQHEKLQVITSKTISLSKQITGHTSFINYLKISPDGQTLFSASADKTIKIWNLGTGQEILTLNGHTSSVNYLEISPDGQTLFSAGADKTIKVWNLGTGQEILTLNGHTSSVNYLEISADGQTLFSAGADKNIKVWNLSTDQEIRTLSGHNSFVNSLALSPDGQTLFSASADKSIKLWNLSTGQEIRTLNGHTSSVNYLEISPDGQTLFSAGADKTIKVWNLATGQEIRTLKDSSFVNYLVINPDGQTLLSGSADKTIKLWNLSTGQIIQTFTGATKPVNYFAISSDWQTIVTGTGDKVIKIWQMPK